MAQLPAEIADFVQQEKSLAHVPQDWDGNLSPRHLTKIITLSCDDTVVGGFELRIKLSRQFPDRDALLQLEYRPVGHRKEELWRCEWRPFGVHINRGWGPPGFEGASITGSHEHRFDHNYLPNERRMRLGGSLPAAVPIEPDLRSLSEFVAFCGKRFRINDLAALRLPSDTGDLFWVPDD